MVCGCAAPRLLARGPVVLDPGGTLSAWLHDGARLEAFARDVQDPQRLMAVDAPVAIDEFAGFGDTAPVSTTSRLVRARAVGAVAPGTFIGVLRKADRAPRDVVAVAGEGAAAVPPAEAPPVLRALWLAPLEERERPGCGAWLTHRVAFENDAGAPPPEAFLVTHVASKRSALVDVRAAGAFGLGHVAVCEQGLPLAAGEAADLEVRPVGAGFGVGAPWVFRSDGTGTTDLVRVASPPSADVGRIAAPFPVPGAPDPGAPGSKRLAAAVMGSVVVGAAVVALVVWGIIPARRRRMQEIACPACARRIPLDTLATLDPATEGFFCPACGAAGFWKGEAKVLPRGPLSAPGAPASSDP